MDLRIASIAIANQMTVLTSNAVDFQRGQTCHLRIGHGARGGELAAA